VKVLWPAVRAYAVGFLIGFVIITALTNHRQTGAIEQLQDDRATTQHQIADLQAQVRRADTAYQQFARQLADTRAAGAASVTVRPACTLHDIYVRTPGC
jgi:hypothetical protein